MKIMTTTITENDLIQSIADAVQFISFYHPADYIEHLARAYEREQNPATRDAIAQILTNSRMCAEGNRPLCQATGVANLFSSEAHTSDTQSPITPPQAVSS